MRLDKCTAAVVALTAAILLGWGNVQRAEEGALNAIHSWAYQLQNVDPLEIKSSPYDLVVIDQGFDRHHPSSFPREVIDMMRRKPNGVRRFVLAYLSIGEAEDYRFYWQDRWHDHPPEWLEPENPDWPGNYPIRYWHPAWQALLFGSPGAYLDRILDAGFDGVYLDGADRYEKWKAARVSAELDMVELIGNISSYARARWSSFVIIPQNGDGLLSNPNLLPSIDGFAREDLLYSEKERGERNSAQSIVESVVRLKAVAAAGKPVLVVE